MAVLTITTVNYTFTSDNLIRMPKTEASIIAEQSIIGKEEGLVQYLGSPPPRLELELILQGTNAFNDYQTLQNIRADGEATVTIKAHNTTLINAEKYFISQLQSQIVPGRGGQPGSIRINITIQLTKLS